MRVLLAEDDDVLADGISLALKQGGYAVDHVSCGQNADHALAMFTYDIAILDLGLPQLDGLEVLQRLRNRGSHLPVLIITAREGLNDRISGLDLGADDYITKPFDLPELEARVRALLRRGQWGNNLEISYGNLRFDTVGRRVSVDSQIIEMSAREIMVLEFLLQRVGRIVTKEQLTEHTYSYGEEVGANAIEVQMHRLRKKLEPYSINIRTIRGLGYLLENLQ